MRTATNMNETENNPLSQPFRIIHLSIYFLFREQRQFLPALVFYPWADISSSRKHPCYNFLHIIIIGWKLQKPGFLCCCCISLTPFFQTSFHIYQGKTDKNNEESITTLSLYTSQQILHFIFSLTSQNLCAFALLCAILWTAFAFSFLLACLVMMKPQDRISTL